MNPENLKSSDVASVLTKDVLAPTSVPLNGTTYMYAVEPGGIVIGLLFRALSNCVHISSGDVVCAVAVAINVYPVDGLPSKSYKKL